MIKSALEYLTGLGKPDVIEVDGQNYTTNQLRHIKEPAPKAVEIITLSGLLDYIDTNIDDLELDNLMIHVCSPREVKLYSSIGHDANRECYISCRALTPDIAFNCFRDPEKFNITLQSCFAETEDIVQLLKVVGNIKEESVRAVGDDGISQEVTAKTGIARVGDVIVPNPVMLAPYRTFPEVEQPTSRFVFRMQNGPRCALFEADGGMWRNEAMTNIKEYLVHKLGELKLDVKIIS